MTREDKRPARPGPGGRMGGLMGGGSALSGLAALIGASCCVLPLILVQLGVSTALVGALTVFARAQGYFMGAAVGLLVAAIIAAFRNGRRPGRGVVIIFAVAAAFIVAAYAAPYLEPRLLRWVSA